MQKYGGSQPADKGLSASPVAGSCGGGNHNCQYALSGPGATSLYIYEHQTSGVLGGQKVGDADYVTPANGVKANVGLKFQIIRWASGTIANRADGRDMGIDDVPAKTILHVPCSLR